MGIRKSLVAVITLLILDIVAIGLVYHKQEPRAARFEGTNVLTYVSEKRQSVHIWFYNRISIDEGRSTVVHSKLPTTLVITVTNNGRKIETKPTTSSIELGEDGDSKVSLAFFEAEKNVTYEIRMSGSAKDSHIFGVGPHNIVLRLFVIIGGGILGAALLVLVLILSVLSFLKSNSKNNKFEPGIAHNGGKRSPLS